MLLILPTAAKASRQQGSLFHRSSLEFGGREFATEGSGLDAAGLSLPKASSHPSTSSLGKSFPATKMQTGKKKNQTKKNPRIILGMMGGNSYSSLMKPFCFSPGKHWNEKKNKKTPNAKPTPLKVDILKRSSNFLLHLKCHHRLLL